MVATKMHLLAALGAILCQAPTIAGRHRKGGQPVPREIIQEARALNARYRHLVTQQDTYYRIHRNRRRQRYSGERGLQQNDDTTGSSHSMDFLQEHLFRQRGEVDNEQRLNDHDEVSLRQVGLEGSAKPLFFCSQCTGVDQHALEECARCKGMVFSQQERIEKAVLDIFPQARVVAKTVKLMNIVYVEMAIAPDDDIAAMDQIMSLIPGVLKIRPQEDSTLDEVEAVNYIGGGADLEARFCGVGGKGVKVAILDSGVDYTHERIGGPGTEEAYRLAYGVDATSDENKQVNPDLFPTEIVYAGRDFLGESFVHTAESLETDAIPDGNPIDANRHGTMVADAILSVAPQTKLLAAKVCTSDTGTCPGFAVVQALEYALDPNEDGNMDDKVDIVNLSLGGSYLSSYYDLRTEALEKVFELGVLPVVAAGNEGNIPYIAGPGAKTPNAVSVAATNNWSAGSHSVVAGYSSRGPGDQNTLKPDISAPSGLTLAAFGTGTEFYPNVQGTSFSAPIVAGALALVKERCPTCSPFAVKSILMNNAKRHVQYKTANQQMSDTDLPIDDAPNSLVGSGEVQLQKALDADVWAYCIEDIQPSLGFGLINAHQQITLTKTVKVINLSGVQQTLRMRNQFSTKALGETQENPIAMSFLPEEQILPEGCGTEVEFQVTMVVDASKAPKNRMTSGGIASNDPATNDWNEFGGWVMVENVETGKDISLAYHAIIRQASDLKIEGSSVIENFQGGPTDVQVGLTNRGAGVAQVDAFELLFTSEDDPEGEYGAEFIPSDFRYIGYRTFQPQTPIPNCDHVLEFSFTTWEKQKRISLEFFQVHIDVNLDNNVDYILFNSGVFTPFADNIGCIVRNKETNEIKCTGMPPDHSTNTGNTVLRVCSNDIGFSTAPTEQQQINVYLLTATATHLGVTEVTDRASEQFHTIEFPKAYISAESYDIYPGETLDTLQIDGTGGNGRGQQPLGLVLITNSYRSAESTGAATRESEALILTNGPLNLPTEVTTDELIFPSAKALNGPVSCFEWKETGTCAIAKSFDASKQKEATTDPMKKATRVNREEESSEAVASADESTSLGVSGHVKAEFESLLFSTRQEDGEESTTCPETDVPRPVVLRVPGSEFTTTQQEASPTMPPGQNDIPPDPSQIMENVTDIQTVTPVFTETISPGNVSTPLGNSTEGGPSNVSAVPLLTLMPTSAPVILSPNATTNATAAIILPNSTQAPSSSATIINASLPTPAPTPLRGNSRPTGPLTAAVVMYDKPTQQEEIPVDALPFETPAFSYSTGVSHCSTMTYAALISGLVLSFVAQIF